MTTKEHLSRHNREIAEIRAILKRTAEQHEHESTEMWALLGKLATGTEAAQQETRELRAAQRQTDAAIRRTDTALRTLIQSMRATNGHRKR